MSGDELELHDEAADKADQSIQEQQELMAEGIPERIERIRAELFAVVEACWLVGSVHWSAIRAGNLETDSLDHALRTLHFSNAGEAYLLTAVEALEALTANRMGDHLDATHVGSMENMDPDWIRGYFIGVHKDSTRNEKVQRLNAVLRSQKPQQEGN